MGHRETIDEFIRSCDVNDRTGEAYADRLVALMEIALSDRYGKGDCAQVVAVTFAGKIDGKVTATAKYMEGSSEVLVARGYGESRYHAACDLALATGYIDTNGCD
jgi:hypothetical protein